MERNLLVNQLKMYEDEFKSFMKIDKFPVYQLQTKEVSLATADAQGFDAAAATFYQPQNASHTLLISTNLILSKYLVFHEFTHMLDSEMYVNGDKIRYAGLSGFTEYHASQIELAQLLNAKTVDDVSPFQMDTVISTFAGEKSVYQYVDEKRQHAVALFRRDDFPADINTLKSALGILCNYFGLRSICEMYSTDYEEVIDNEAFLKFIPTLYFTVLNNLMHGWLEKSEIELSIKTYIGIIMPIIKDFGLA